MEIFIGVALALSVAVFATVTGFDRDRAFYPTVMIVIALLWVLFAVIGGSVAVLRLELLVMAVFVAAAVAGFRYSLWLVSAALIAHGVFDYVHDRLYVNPGAPAWYADFCIAYDIVAGLYLAVLLQIGRLRARPLRTAAST
jgi:hypothetical protein